MEKLEYHLQVFDGPLDLLLALIAKNKLDIYDIPISELLDQYLEQIALMREADMGRGQRVFGDGCQAGTDQGRFASAQAGGRRGPQSRAYRPAAGI